MPNSSGRRSAIQCVSSPTCSTRARVNDDGMSHEFVKDCGRRREERKKRGIFWFHMAVEWWSASDGWRRASEQAQLKYKKDQEVGLRLNFRISFFKPLQQTPERKWKAKATETITISVDFFSLYRCTAHENSIRNSSIVGGLPEGRPPPPVKWVVMRETSGKCLNLHQDILLRMNIRFFLCFDQFFMLFFCCLFVCLCSCLWVGWLRLSTRLKFTFFFWTLVCAFSGVSVCPKFLRNLNLFCVFLSFLSPLTPQTPALLEWKVFFMRVVLFWWWKKKQNSEFSNWGSFPFYLD